MQALLRSWAFAALCMISVFRGSNADCATAGSGDETCEKMLLVTKKLPVEPSNAFLQESEEGVEEKERASNERGWGAQKNSGKKATKHTEKNGMEATKKKADIGLTEKTGNTAEKKKLAREKWVKWRKGGKG